MKNSLDPTLLSSEAANALAAPAIAAALHDTTGKVLRRLPLKPAYVRALSKLN